MHKTPIRNRLAVSHEDLQAHVGIGIPLLELVIDNERGIGRNQLHDGGSTDYGVALDLYVHILR